ncbi:MAG TPA: SHOCT domain-containing protein, partial [Candidatus Limnocylindrales bacterium]
EENADDYHMLHHAPTFKKTMLLAKQDIEDELARRITAPLEALNARESEQDRREAEAQASARTAPPPPVVPAAPAQKTAEEKLRELAALRDAGLITPEDFEAKKTTILATM